MKAEYLETVLMVAKLESFSKAALEIPCAQSSVSRQVRSVEDDLGVCLFQRSSNSNHVALTPAGTAMLPGMERMLREYKALQALSERPGVRRQTLVRWGVSASIFSAASQATLSASLYLVHPEIVLELSEVRSGQFKEQLEGGKLDAVLFYRSCRRGEAAEETHSEGELRCVSLAPVELTIGMQASHPLAGRARVAARDLACEAFIFNSDITKNTVVASQHGMFLSMCREAGFVPRILTVERNLADIKQTMASRGEGIYPSFTPKCLCTYQGIRYVPVEDAPYYAQYYLLSSENRKPIALETLGNFLRDVFSENGA